MQKLPSELIALISTYNNDYVQTSLLTKLAGGMIIKEIRNGKTYGNGVLHSFNDEPAEIDIDGDEGDEDIYHIWYKLGRIHRDGDKPAMTCKEYSDGELYMGYSTWYQNGEEHRDGDLPAQIWEDGTQEWYQFGERHREGDLPAEILDDGTKIWYKHGKIHRGNDKPAVITSQGTKHWFYMGKRYRLNNKPVVVSGSKQYWATKDGLVYGSNKKKGLTEHELNLFNDPRYFYISISSI